MKNWIAILAISKNGIIGRDNSLPWNIEEEKEFFRNTVSGKTILVGRKTFESLKKIDEHSKYLILTRNHDYKVERKNCIVVHELKTIYECYGNEELWICGGKEIYSSCIRDCNQIIVSFINKNHMGNVRFTIPYEELLFVKDIKVTDEFTTKSYINRKFCPCSRFSSYNEMERAYNRYVEGAVHGVVGHHVNYPVLTENTGSIEEYVKVIKNVYSDTINLYIHWPYCNLPNGLEKCDFCMCNTKNTKKDFIFKDDYFKCILKEIRMYAEVLRGKKVGNVYIGGGTPLTMTADMLDQIFTTINSAFERSENALFSIESRPEMLTIEKLKVLANHRINKISIGVESLNNDLACEMGRIKAGEDYFEIVKSGVEKVKEAGIEYINIDLLYSHPSETEESIDETLYKVLLLKPDTISFYCMGLPAGCTNIEKEQKYAEKWKSLEYRSKQYLKINHVLELSGYKQVVESIWEKKDDTKKV